MPGPAASRLFASRTLARPLVRTLAAGLAVVALTAAGRQEAVAPSSVADMADYAAELVEIDQADKAYQVYKLVISSLSRAGKTQPLRRICSSMFAVLPARPVTEPGSPAWICPDPDDVDEDGQPRFADRPAKLIYSLYPQAMDADGEVLLGFDITAVGTVENIRVISDSSSDHAAAAVEVLEASRFHPALHNGSPRAERGRTISIRFKGAE